MTAEPAGLRGSGRSRADPGAEKRRDEPAGAAVAHGGEGGGDALIRPKRIYNLCLLHASFG